MKVSDYVIQTLIEHGVTHVFCLPGGFSMHLNDSLNYSNIKPVYCLHEAGAGFAACGYAAYSGKLGVALVTSGPGSTNILTAVASAWQDSLPLLVISGEAKTERIKLRHRYHLRQGGAQDVPIMDICKPIAKCFQLAQHFVTFPKNIIEQQLDLCITQALTPRRGPAWLAIPLDVQEMEI